MKRKKLIITILIIIIAIAFIIFNLIHIPRHPKWKLPNWIDKYGVEITEITYQSVNNNNIKDQHLASSKYYDFINILDTIINNKVRFNPTLTDKQWNTAMQTDYHNNFGGNFSISFDNSNHSTYGKIPISLYKAHDIYIIGYPYFLNTKIFRDFIMKEIAQDDFETILSYLK